MSQTLISARATSDDTMCPAGPALGNPCLNKDTLSSELFPLAKPKAFAQISITYVMITSYKPEQ